MMTLLYSPPLLGLGLTALTASLMSGLAANVSAFAALWTEDIYRRKLVVGQPEKHYLRVGRWSILAAVVISAGCSSVSFYFDNLMNQVQMIFSLLSAPLWAIFVLGLTTARTTTRGVLCGFSCGIAVAVLHHICFWRGWLHYGSLMSANFYVAVLAFSSSFAVG